MRINALEREIAQRVEMVAPQLLELPGCAALTTAKIVGETANIARFRSEACFAMHAGVAPIPASSGRTQRHRLARGGNRQLNAALHRIAPTQVGMSGGPGHTYYQRRRAKGDRVRNTVTAGWACTPPPPSTTAPPKPSATSATVLGHAYRAHPQRFVRNPPKPPKPPIHSWINPPNPPEEPLSKCRSTVPQQVDRFRLDALSLNDRPAR